MFDEEHEISNEKDNGGSHVLEKVGQAGVPLFEEAWAEFCCGVRVSVWSYIELFGYRNSGSGGWIGQVGKRGSCRAGLWVHR